MRPCEVSNFSAADVSGMLQLNHELHELPPQFLLRAQHLLNGICRLIGAQVALFSELHNYLPERQWTIRPLLDLGWTDTAARSRFMSFFKGEQLDDPLTPLCTRLEGDVATVLRRQKVSDRDWYLSANVNELRRKSGLDDCIYSHFRLGQSGRALGIAFHRAWNDRPFTERERAIVDLMHRWQPIYRPDFSSCVGRKFLSQRQLQVLEALQNGCSEKEVARTLHLSPNTVHVHVKAIYRYFGVNSRSELLSLWVRRG